MPRIPIPSNKQWRGQFQGEFFGNVHFGRGVDPDRNQGVLTLGDSLSSIFDDTDDADLTTPVAFLRTAADGTDRWWVNAGKLFKTTNTDPEAGWTQDAISNSPTAPLYDLFEFVDDMYCPVDTDISQLSGGTWDADWWSTRTNASALQSGVPHRIWEFAGAMLITDGRYINTWDGTLAEDPALTLPSNRQAQWGRATNDFSFIGTKTLDGTEAEVFFWDRVSDTFNSRYGIGDVEALCGFAVAGIPYLVTKRGSIKRFTGQGFQTVQEFPTVEANSVITDINPNGVFVEENTVKMVVDFGSNSIFRALSGVWTYNTDTNNLLLTEQLTNGTDYGQGELDAVGAIKQVPVGQGRFLVGGSVYTAYTGTTKQAIFTSDEGSTSARGYFVTSKIPAQNVRNFYRQVFAKFRKLKNSSDRIRIAYQVAESNTLPAYETITWVTSTTFTGSNSNVTVGDFVEIIAGDNAGALAKITDIASGTPNTYTIDTTLNASTSTARARYLPFTDLGTISSQTIQEQVYRITARGHWVRFLVYLQGDEESPEFEELLLDFDQLRL